MQSYEDLGGATGRKMFYRAERFEAASLFKGVAPSVLLGNEPASLKNLSMTGVAVDGVRPEGWDGRLGAEVPFELCMDEARLYSGRGLVRRVEQNGARALIALELTSGHLDIPKLVTAHDNFLLARSLADPAFGTSEGILPDFISLCTEIVNLFRSYKELLEAFEQRLTLRGPEREERLLDALAACEERAVAQWKELWLRGSDILQPIWKEPAMLALHKRYAERVLTPDFMPGAVMRRCYEKPRGYPGDYQIMNYVYEWQRVGDTPYEKLLHRIGIETGACVGTRLRMTQKTLADEIAREKSDAMMHITNLGCGSAYEVHDYLRIGHLPRPVHFTLIDQDSEALAYAYEHAYPQVMRHAGRARLQCLEASFSQMMKAGNLFQTLPPQDVIYSLGLFDYFAKRRAQALARDLYEKVKPGGKLIIANVRKHRESCEWPLELITDWSLIYRSEADMRVMVADLDGAEMSLDMDETKCIWLMTIRKPL